MFALMALGTTSLILCLLLTPLCRDIFLKHGLVDSPDNDRKLHKKPIPRIGGIPIALSYVGGLALLLAFAPRNATIAIQHKELLWSLLPAAGIVFVTGLVDDLVGLKPWQKLGGQLVGALVAVGAGARITLLHGHPYGEWLTIPLSIFWLIGCTNAFNLIDGMDGLASGVGLFATLTTLLAALLQGNWGLAMATVPLAGCLLAFLVYNFNPASVFLGDSGSLSVGFLLGCFGVIWSQKSATLLGMLAPVMAMALPLLDVSLSIGRRFLRNQPIFQADRGHIHHRLLALGFKTQHAALILYAVCFVAALFSLLQSSLSFHVGGLIIILFCSLSWIGIKSLGYVEFSTAKRVLANGGILRLMEHEIHLEHFRQALSRASTRAECWTTIRTACRDLKFSAVELTLRGERFHEVFRSGETQAPWTFSLSLGRADRITLSRVVQSQSPSVLTSFFETLQCCMEIKTYPTEMSPDSELDLGNTNSDPAKLDVVEARMAAHRAAAS